MQPASSSCGHALVVLARKVDGHDAAAELGVDLGDRTGHQVRCHRIPRGALRENRRTQHQRRHERQEAGHRDRPASSTAVASKPAIMGCRLPSRRSSSPSSRAASACSAWPFQWARPRRSPSLTVSGEKPVAPGSSASRARRHVEPGVAPAVEHLRQAVERLERRPPPQLGARPPQLGQVLADLPGRQAPVPESSSSAAIEQPRASAPGSRPSTSKPSCTRRPRSAVWIASTLPVLARS